MKENVNEITSFTGEYAFLSNFYPSPFIFKYLMDYPTVEHAYQAYKTVGEEHQKIRNLPTPAQAKRAGRLVKLRPDWELIKIDLMHELVLTKFTQNQDLGKLLIETGDAKLVEGNWWGDTFWGVCNGKGKNHLGKILMKIRNNLNCEEWLEEK